MIHTVVREIEIELPTINLGESSLIPRYGRLTVQECMIPRYLR